MILNLTSSQTVIAKVIADLDISEDNLRVSDMQEWIGEAISKIGGVGEMNSTDIILPICNYQCKLPNGLKNIKQVAYASDKNNVWVSTLKSAGSFNTRSDIRIESPEDQIVTEHEYVSIYKQMNASRNLTYKEALDELNDNVNMKGTIKSMIAVGEAAIRTPQINTGHFKIQYFIKPGHLVFNVRTGFAKLAATAIARDEFGYPLVPEMDTYIEAIYWYIVTKLLYPRFLSGKLSYNALEHAEAQYHIYSNRAYGELKSPNLDELEAIKNVWIRNFPMTNEHESFYEKLSYPQEFYNH